MATSMRRGESAYGARKEVTADSVRADCTTGDEKETKSWIKCDRGLVNERKGERKVAREGCRRDAVTEGGETGR